MRKLLSWIMAVTSLTLALGISAVNAAVPYEDLVLESVFFTDGKGMVIPEPQGREDLVPYIVLSKKEGGEAFAGAAVVASYDENGRLYSVSACDVADPANIVYGEAAYQIVRNTYQAPKMDVPEQGSARVYYWNSKVGMEPYSVPTAALPAPEDQYTGEITFPQEFEEKMNGRFTIFKEPGVRKYSHTATPETVYDWSAATEIFLDATLNADSAEIKERDGLTRETAITGKNFAQNYRNGLYQTAQGGVEQKQDTFIFTLLNDLYSGATDTHSIPLGPHSTSPNTQLPEQINALVRSGSPSGFTWMGRMRMQNSGEITEKWNEYDPQGHPDVYRTVQGTSTASVVTLMNFVSTDEYAMPVPYTRAASPEEVREREGSFYQDQQDKSTIYCHPYSGHQAEDITLMIETGLLDSIRKESTKAVMFENIGITPRLTSNDTNQFGGGDYDNAVFGFFGCKISGGAFNALSLYGQYTAYLFDTVCAYGFRDGFNYHDTGVTPAGNSTVIEVNCTSYDHGDTHPIFGSAQVQPGVTNNSNNASTAHDRIRMLRVGGRYWNTQGPIVGDLNTLTVTMGCEAYNFNVNSPSERTSFSVSDDGNVGTARNKYFVDSYGTGIRIRAGIVGNENTYVLDFMGNTRLGLGNSGVADPLKPLTWENITSGSWKE